LLARGVCASDALRIQQLLEPRDRLVHHLTLLLVVRDQRVCLRELVLGLVPAHLLEPHLLAQLGRLARGELHLRTIPGVLAARAVQRGLGLHLLPKHS
jgi:hypothetical protein